MLLAGVQVTVFETAGGYGSGEGDLHNPQVRQSEDLHVIGRYPVELAHRLRGEGGVACGAGVVLVGVGEDVDGEPEWAGVFRSNLAGEIADRQRFTHG